MEIQGGHSDEELAPEHATLKDRLEAFTRVVRLGGFAPVSGDASFAILDGAAQTRRVSLVLPPVSEAALRPLWHMTALGGATAIAITEACDDADATCSLADPIRTHASFPFELQAAESKGLSLSLVLGMPNAREALRAIVPLVEAWAKLVALMGFRGARAQEPSHGWVSDVALYLEDEVTITLDDASIDEEAWAVLANVLVPIHEVFGIVSLSFPD